MSPSERFLEIWTDLIHVDWRDWKVILLTITSPLVVTYILSLVSASSFIRNASSTSRKRPPWAPYYLPVLGHSLDMVTRPFALFDASVRRFGRGGLFGVYLFGDLSAYHVTTPEQTAKVFRAQNMIMTEGHARALERGFGMPRVAACLYENDDSGYGPRVASDSTLSPEQRIMYHGHNIMNRGLTGDTLATITTKYQEFLVRQFSDLAATLPQDGSWYSIPDINGFFRTHIMRAAVNAVFGPHLLRLNPGFIQDFWKFNPTITPMFMGVPQWLFSGMYSRRNRLRDAVMKWHAFAHENYDLSLSPKDEDGPAWEEFFGSRLNRKRQKLFANFEEMDPKARAAEDFSFAWASNANSAEAATWNVIEMLRDPDLLIRMRDEFSSAINHLPSSAGTSKLPTFDVDKLCSSPLAQSVYAEVLRLRVSVMVYRKVKTDMEFSGYEIKSGERVAVASTLMGRDEEVWNQGTEEDPHPLSEFWAERFIVKDDDPTSGPLKPRPTAKTPAAGGAKMSDIKKNGLGEGGKYSMEGLTNSWIPYSGGARLCPGRHFAKQEMILTAAHTVSAFDMELLTPKGWVPQCDLAYFGFGTMPAKGKVPCRIRPRKGWFKATET